MCGITGFSNFKRNIDGEYETLVNMNNALVHRGPDGYGYFSNKNVMFGHRRLSIVDLSGGAQPMSKIHNGKTYTIVYNGEIYNTENIKNDLMNFGYEFETYSDTEVVLTSYIHYKEKCLKHLNGIFAFSIFDEERKCVFMARDHLGVKPLFYSIKNDYLIFSSEIKGMLKHPLINRFIDEQGLLELLSLGPSRSLGGGIFKDVKEVPPAHYLYFSNDKIFMEKYWDLEAREYTLDLNDTVSELSFILENIVVNQMVSDRKILGFLSGGIDSSLICSIMSKELKKQNKILNTFTVDYVDYDKDFKENEFEVSKDKDFAFLVSESIGSHNEIITIKNEDLFYNLDKSLYASDIPSMADIDTSLYLFCKGVRKFGVVALSGECADEVFGGYPWYLNNDMKFNSFPWSRFSSLRKNLFNDKIKKFDFDSYIESEVNETLKDIKVLDSDSFLDVSIRKMTLLNIKWFMVTLLNRKDRMSMANGLEVRVPFADKNLIEYAYNIPSKMKFLNGREKGILREVSKNFLPEVVVNRKKSPYPKTQSKIYTDLVCMELNKILKNKNNPIFQLINESEVRKLVETRGESYTKPWFGQLMRGPQLIAYLIQLNNWIERCNVNINI